MIDALYKIFLECTGISTDTRTLKKGNLFFALKGDNFNGNVYAKKALEAGASCAVVDDETYVKGKDYFLVENVLQTLQELATHHRQVLKLPIIALTGSNGKTTTKELINAVLSKRYNTVATKGNLNNHIGVPLTLLSMSKETELGIVEMGANHIGEIKNLCHIAQPNYGYITNFGKAHLEGFGSEEGIIQGKSELYKYLKAKDGLIFYNEDDKLQYKLTRNANTFSFGKDKTANVSVHLKDATPFVNVQLGEAEINSQLIGIYNASNIAAAVAIGNYFEVDRSAIKSAIEAYTPANNRSQIIKKEALTIILDAYNANPTSMMAALENIERLEAPYKTVILGDMFELGQYSEAEHQAIAEQAKSYHFDSVILVGEHFKNTDIEGDSIQKYRSTEDFLNTLDRGAFTSGVLLIKGSRGMALERVLDHL